MNIEEQLVFVNSARANQMIMKQLIDEDAYWVDEDGHSVDSVKNHNFSNYLAPYTLKITVNPNLSEKQTTVITVGPTLEKHTTVARYLWDKLEDVIVDDDGHIESDWNIFEAGTHREYIWHFFEEELGVSVANLMGINDSEEDWCDEALAMLNGYTMPSENKNRTYYTLRCGKTHEEDILKDADSNIKEFDTYEEAYDQMVNIYSHSLCGKHYTYAENPIRYKIYETKVSFYNGRENSMTQQI